MRKRGRERGSCSHCCSGRWGAGTLRPGRREEEGEGKGRGKEEGAAEEGSAVPLARLQRRRCPWRASAALERSHLGSASWAATVRLLSGQLKALGGFLPTHASPPARRGNPSPSLTGNIEPKSTCSYTQSLPPPSHSMQLSLFFHSSSLPSRKRLPHLLQFHTLVLRLLSSLAPYSDAKDPPPRPRPFCGPCLCTRGDLEGVRRSPGKKRKEGNRIG